MISRIFTIFAGTLICVAASFAQTDLQVKKKVTRTMPGMEQIPTGALSPEMKKQLNDMKSSTATVYIKGSWMRTDSTMKMPKKTGEMETHTFSTVVQCDKQRTTTFDTKNKKYHQYSISGQGSSGGKNAKTGGYITVSGTVTDTGERAKLFGFDARRLKQTIIFTPSANACHKQKFQVEIDGWYADLPEFSCPIKTAMPDGWSGSDCEDDLDYQLKDAVTGIALKEIKKLDISGQIMTIDEEATEVNRTTLPDSLFEPPAGYKAANAVKEVQDDSRSGSAKTNETIVTTNTTAITSSSDSAPLPLPSAGIEKQMPTEKRAAVIRIGIARPEVTTPESKKDPNAGTDIAIAVTKSLMETLKAENVEAVELSTDSPADECRAKGCDYIFYANVTQKRGGGMFGKVMAMGATTAAGMLIPGVGGMIASTAGSVIMGQTMGKATKAKDEFTFEYKVSGMDSAVLSQAVSKAKAKEGGEDVLTPQLQQASKTVLGEIAKKKSAVTP